MVHFRMNLTRKMILNADLIPNMDPNDRSDWGEVLNFTVGGVECHKALWNTIICIDGSRKKRLLRKTRKVRARLEELGFKVLVTC